MRGGIATILGILGGVLIMFGAVAGAIVGFFGDLLTGDIHGLPYLFYGGIVDLVLGLLVLVFTGFARSHPAPDKASGGLIVLVVSAIAWFLVQGNVYYVLVVLGSILGLLAGILFLTESAFRGPPVPANRQS